jgi:hypothetical protein
VRARDLWVATSAVACRATAGLLLLMWWGRPSLMLPSPCAPGHEEDPKPPPQAFAAVEPGHVSHEPAEAERQKARQDPASALASCIRERICSLR